MNRDAGSSKPSPTRNSRRTNPFSLKFVSSAILITLLIAAIMVIIAEKELLSVFELPPTACSPVFTPLHLFFLLNLLIVSIILISHLHRGREVHAAAATSHHTMLSAPLLLDHNEEGAYAQNEASSPAGVIKLLHNDDGEHEEIHSREKSVRFDDQREMNEEFKHDIVRSGRSWSEIDKTLVQGDHQRQIGGLVKQSAGVVMELEGNGADDCAETGHENVLAAAVSIDEQKPSEQWCSILDQERPLASTHFSHKKTANRVHACKSPLKISRPSVRKGDTLDATWKAICEEKAKHSSPFRNRMASRARKTDCHIAPNIVEIVGKSKDSHEACSSPSKQKHRMANSSNGGLMRRREPSMSRDELNIRVESFISRFNQQMKIQRQQSLLSHKRMVDRGAK